MAATLLERDREMARAGALLGSCRAGLGAVLLITGIPGIGKTELLAQIVRRGADQGFTTLKARGSEIERGFAHGVTLQLFETVLSRAEPSRRRAWLQGAASLAEPLLTGAGPPDPVALPRPPAGDPALPLHHALFWLAANLAAEQPRVISVDDLQWVDEASISFLLYLASRVEGLSILLATAARTSEKASELVAQLERSCDLEHLPLAGLSPEASADMVRGRLGKTSEEFERACHDSTGGNPFLLKELMRSLADSGAGPDASQVRRASPPSLARAVLLRIQGSAPRAVELARTVAILGDRAELRLAARICGLEIEEAGIAADALVEADILKDTRPLEFVHPLVQAAIYDDIAPSQRSLSHGAAARLLAEEGEPLQKVAVHLVEAEPNGDRWVVGSLRSAAAEAVARGALGSAIVYLRRALREPPSPRERPGVLQELGRAEIRDDPGGAVEHLREAFEHQADAAARARTGLDLLRALFGAGRVGEAVEVVEAALAGLDGAHPALAMQLDAELISLLRIGVATSPLGYRRLSRWKGKVNSDSPPERVLLLHLSVVSAISGAAAAEFGESAERALGDGLLLAEHGPDSLITYLPLYPLICAERYQAAERYLAKCFATARERGSPQGFQLSSGWRSYLNNARGDVKEAEADAVNGLRILTDQQKPHPIFLSGAVEALLPPLIEKGEFDRAEAALRELGLLGELPDAVPFRFLLASRGYLRLAEGRAGEAMNDFAELIARESSFT